MTPSLRRGGARGVGPANRLGRWTLGVGERYADSKGGVEILAPAGAVIGVRSGRRLLQPKWSGVGKGDGVDSVAGVNQLLPRASSTDRSPAGSYRLCNGPRAAGTCWRRRIYVMPGHSYRRSRYLADRRGQHVDTADDLVRPALDVAADPRQLRQNLLLLVVSH